MNVITWRQGDPRWGAEILGLNNPGARDNLRRPYNLANYGCLISDLASLVATITQDASWTPSKVNQLFKANGGFDSGTGLLRWYRVPQLLPMLADHGFEPSNTIPRGWLDKPANWAVLKVNNGAHYVLAINPTQIMDPINGGIKSIKTYPVSAVRLYEAVGGKGSGATISTSTSSEVPMNDEQEKQAYRIVLGREREGAATSRTGLQFILDAQGELAQQRAAKQSQVAVLNDQNTVLGEKVTSITAMVEELQRQAKTHETDWQTTYREDKRKLIAKEDADIMDLAGEQPVYHLKRGMLVRQAGTFIKDGQVYARSQNSADRNDWYGYPLELFDIAQSIPNPDATDRVQAVTAQAYGLLERVRLWFENKRKKGSN